MGDLSLFIKTNQQKSACLCHWRITNYRFYFSNSCLEQSISYLLLIHIAAPKFHPCPNYTVLNSSSALNSRFTKDPLPGIDWALQGAQTRRGRTGWKPFPPPVSNLLMIAWGKYWKYCFCVKFATSSCQLSAKQLFPSTALGKRARAAATRLALTSCLGCTEYRKH